MSNHSPLFKSFPGLQFSLSLSFFLSQTPQLSEPNFFIFAILKPIVASLHHHKSELLLQPLLLLLLHVRTYSSLVGNRDKRVPKDLCYDICKENKKKIMRRPIAVVLKPPLQSDYPSWTAANRCGCSFGWCTTTIPRHLSKIYRSIEIVVYT